MGNPFGNDEKLIIPAFEGCKKCGFYSINSEKCMEKRKKKCNCDKPQLGEKYRNYEEIGFCANCNHFIIRKSFDAKTNTEEWEHYRRAYSCGIPYKTKICQAPLIACDIDIANMHKEQFEKNQIGDSLNIQEVLKGKTEADAEIDKILNEK